MPQLHEWLDSVPIFGVFLAFAVVSLIVYEVGYRLGRWWQKRTPDEVEGPTGVIVGSLLALMAFLLAITMGMASERFDARRADVLEEANAIGTTWLRAGYLPEPASTRSRELVAEYVPLRIVYPDADVDAILARVRRTNEITQELWIIAQDLAKAAPESDLLAIYVESLNDTIDVGESRVIAGLFARVPETVLYLLIIGSVLTLGMVGYGAGLTRRRSSLTAVVLVVVLGAVVTLVIDIDRPQGGLLSVNQRPLQDLQAQLEAAPD
jgi:hypothetical protein